VIQGDRCPHLQSIIELLPGVQKDPLKPQDGNALSAGSKAQQHGNDPKPAAAQPREATRSAGKSAASLLGGGGSGSRQALQALSITEFEELEARWGLGHGLRRC
jgi:hypothetical protein